MGWYKPVFHRKKTAKLEKIGYFLLYSILGAGALYVLISIGYWGPSGYFNRALLSYRLLWVSKFLLLMLLVGIGSFFGLGLWKKRLSRGSLFLGITGILVLYSYLWVSAAIPKSLHSLNEIYSCHFYQMVTIYKGMQRYWSEHDYHNPKGTGPGGQLTQEDWHRELRKYGNVWKDLRDKNNQQITFFKCPLDNTYSEWSYEINLNIKPAPVPLKEWVVRECWDPNGVYHYGHRAILFGSLNHLGYGISEEFKP